MDQFATILSIISAILLILLVILQSKGTGMGTAFGGDMGFYGTKRGAEKMLFYLTIIISVVFLASSIFGILA